jgi:hypothetical protein
MRAILCQTTNLLYVAAAGCTIYLSVAWLALLFIEGRASADRYAIFFLMNYKGLLTGIPIFTLHLISERFLRLVPVTISKCILYSELKKTKYRESRKRYSSTIMAVAQSSCYFVMSYGIFSALQFGQGFYEDIFLKLYSCAQVYSVCYVARKLYHIGRMLEAIKYVDVDEKLFMEDKLSGIVVTVNIFTFSMIVALIIHTIVHYNLKYTSSILDSDALKLLVVTPVLLILPVLVLFNFQPRAVVNSLYRLSIAKRKAKLSALIEQSHLTEVEKQKQLIDYEKFLKDELRYHYRLIFTEAPVVLTIVFSVLTILIRMI